MKEIKAYKLTEGWKLYDSNIDTDWILSIMETYNLTNKKTIIDDYLKDYLFDENTGELFNTNDEKVGQYALQQQTIDPYIYMTDSSYIRVLSKYESIIKESAFAKKCYQNYLDNKLDDV